MDGSSKVPEWKQAKLTIARKSVAQSWSTGDWSTEIRAAIGLGYDAATDADANDHSTFVKRIVADADHSSFNQDTILHLDFRLSTSSPLPIPIPIDTRPRPRRQTQRKLRNQKLGNHHQSISGPHRDHGAGLFRHALLAGELSQLLPGLAHAQDQQSQPQDPAIARRSTSTHYEPRPPHPQLTFPPPPGRLLLRLPRPRHVDL